MVLRKFLGLAILMARVHLSLPLTVTATNFATRSTSKVLRFRLPAHIHRAALGRAGDVVVPLTAPDEDGYAAGCVAVDKTLAGQILANPANFYVNVHTSDFPNGALRGQLFGSTRLMGAEEVPGPGDPDGFGAATILFDTAKNQVCWAITVEDITLPATAAHIHKAKIGQAGDVVVPLSAPDEDGVALGCTTADAALVRDIQANPQNYYVNVHTSDFPNGALRGQLRAR